MDETPTKETRQFGLLAGGKDAELKPDAGVPGEQAGETSTDDTSIGEANGEARPFGLVAGGKDEPKPITVLLLDDSEENLLLRSAILRQKGYRTVSSASIEDAQSKLNDIDIAVLDYHLGAGKFGTEVAHTLREQRPEVPVIILSATLERKFGGIADMHLLKGSSSVEDLVQALRSFEGKQRGRPVVVDSRDFYYSRIIMAMSDDMVIEILDRDGNWQYVNEYFAALSQHRRGYYRGRNIFDDFPEMRDEWGEILRTVADTRETYIDRRNHRTMPHLPNESPHWQWNVLAFPIKLHDGQDGVVLSARLVRK